MSFDADEGEIREAVTRGDSEWVWSVVQHAYEERDSRQPKVISLSLADVTDAAELHHVFAEALGFPEFYGRNFNAWIDCMTHLDDHPTTMTSFHVQRGQVLVLELLGIDRFRVACPALHLALVDSVAFVNARRLQSGAPAILALSYGAGP